MGLCQDVGYLIDFPRVAAALSAAYTLCERPAVPLLTQAMEQTIATETIYLQAHCRLVLREAHLLAGHLEEAEALALAEELGMRPLVAHCHLGLSMLHTKMGQRDQTRAALSTAEALYRDMGMTFWLPPAEAALAQVEALSQ